MKEYKVSLDFYVHAEDEIGAIHRFWKLIDDGCCPVAPKAKEIKGG